MPSEHGGLEVTVDAGKGPRQAFQSESTTTQMMDYSAFESRFLPMVDRTWFCASMSLLTVANMLALGLQADYKCRSNCGSSSDAPWNALDVIFTLIFVLDVIIALVVLTPSVYFLGDPEDKAKSCIDAFRCLDFTLVLLRVVDVFILSPAGVEDSYLKFVSALRVLHLGRLAKRIQLFGVFRELWLILQGITDTLRTVAWVGTLLVLVLWVFAVIVTMIVNDGTVYNYSKTVWTKDDYWGTVPRSLFSLFQVLTRDKWSHSLVWPLIEAKIGLMIVFALFLCIALFALLNTVVGVVVESTLRSARENEEKEAKHRQKQDAKIMQCLQRIFQEADTDNSGNLDRRELAEAMKNYRVKKALAALEISKNDLELLFSLLDEDGSGNIRTEVFFRGCTRLRGPAMARDLQTISVDLDRHVKTSGKQIKQLRSVNDHISSILDTIDTIEVDIVKDPQDEKDPVLMARRGRTRESRSSFLRTNLDGDDESNYTIDLGDHLPESKSKRRGAVAAEGRPPRESPSRQSSISLRNSADCQYRPPANPRPPPLPAHLRNGWAA